MRIYSGEKIEVPGAYKKIAQMREIRILKESEYYNWSNFSYHSFEDYMDTFVKQAEFMADFEDDYSERNVPFLHVYSPTYKSLTDTQLRRYFTWRTEVRKGIVKNIETSYAYLYVFELLNNIGVESFEQGIMELINFWVKFRKHNVHMDEAFKRWITDYFVMGDFPHDYSHYTDLFPVKSSSRVDIIHQIKKGVWDINFLELNSKHKITKTAFFKPEYEHIITDCTSFVMNNLLAFFKDKNQNFLNIFFQVRHQTYRPFNLARYKMVGVENKVVYLNEYERFKIDNNSWTKTWVDDKKFLATKTYIVKLIEINLRKKFGEKRGLKEPYFHHIEEEFKGYLLSWEGLKSWREEIFAYFDNGSVKVQIEKAVAKYFETKKIIIKKSTIDLDMEEEIPINIDVSKLDKIREEHDIVAEKLNTEEEMPFVEQTTVVVSQIVEGWDFLFDLEQKERELLRSLLDNKDTPKDFLLLTEIINEKALDSIGDNIIDICEKPYIYDEYKQEIADRLGGL